MSAVSREEGKANVKEKEEALRGSFSPLFISRVLVLVLFRRGRGSDCHRNSNSRK